MLKHVVLRNIIVTHFQDNWDILKIKTTVIILLFHYEFHCVDVNAPFITDGKFPASTQQLQVSTMIAFTPPDPDQILKLAASECTEHRENAV